jgi:hypothetical protein
MKDLVFVVFGFLVDVVIYQFYQTLVLFFKVFNDSFKVVYLYFQVFFTV